MGSIGTKQQSTDTNKSSIPALNPDLIRRANESGLVVDYGDSAQKTYTSRVDEIQNMNLTDEEKHTAIEKLHALTEAQLEAEAKSKNPYGFGMGPARFNAKKVQADADRAIRARDETASYMESLRKEQRQRAQKAEMAGLTQAMKTALDNKTLSFEYNGKRYYRNSLRAKSFMFD